MRQASAHDSSDIAFAYQLDLEDFEPTGRRSGFKRKRQSLAMALLDDRGDY
jgi:hypothetical protein